MAIANVGFAEGTCGVCGKTLRRRRPADYAVCDCYQYCPLCGKKMTPYIPDLSPTTYEPEKGLDVFFVCNDHSPPYYSKQKPVEVHLSWKIESMKELNEKLARVARVVVHPKYRTIGAGAKLLHDSLSKCGKPYVEMIAVMARYNPFAEHAGMTKVCKSKLDMSIIEAIANLEKLDFTPYLLSVPEYNKQMLKGQVQQVKEILSRFGYPYNRRIAGQHGHFTLEDYRKWLKKAKTSDLAQALRHLAQLNQTKVYLFWKKL